MINRIILCIALLTSGGSYGQEIKSNTLNGFTQERTIATTVLSLRSSISKGLGISFTSVGSHYVVNINGYGDGLGPISDSDYVYFLLDGRMILTATSIGNQPSHDGSVRKVFQHNYVMRLKDFQDLVKKRCYVIRITTTSKNYDIRLTKKSSKQLHTFAQVFVNEVNQYMMLDNRNMEPK